MTGINNLRLKNTKLEFIVDYKISPIYQPIRDIDKQGIKFGDPSVPNPVQTFAAWDHLRQVYQKTEEEPK
jgi:hypothetical protein